MRKVDFRIVSIYQRHIAGKGWAVTSIWQCLTTKLWWHVSYCLFDELFLCTMPRCQQSTVFLLSFLLTPSALWVLGPEILPASISPSLPPSPPPYAPKHTHNVVIKPWSWFSCAPVLAQQAAPRKAFQNVPAVVVLLKDVVVLPHPKTIPFTEGAHFCFNVLDFFIFTQSWWLLWPLSPKP